MDFGTAIIVLSIAAAIVACLSYIGSGRIYERVGKGDFALDTPDRMPGPKPGSAAARAEQEEEVRQMLQAKSDRLEARGEPALDVESELRQLLRPAPADEGLRDEVRQLVIAKNERRQRRGEEPLDVEEEVDRQLRDLGA